MDSPVFWMSDPGSCPDLIIAATGAMFEIRKVRISGLLDFQTFVLTRWFCHPDLGISCVLFFWVSHHFPFATNETSVVILVCPRIPARSAAMTAKKAPATPSRKRFKSNSRPEFEGWKWVTKKHLNGPRGKMVGGPLGMVLDLFRAL